MKNKLNLFGLLFGLTLSWFAQSTEKAVQFQIDQTMAPVKSEADLYILSDYDSPLNKLSGNGKNAFINSITFNGNGITGFETNELENQLTVSEIYKVLTLLGMQSSISQFKNAKVSKPIDALLLKHNENLLKAQTLSDEKDDGIISTDQEILEGYSCAGVGTCKKNSGFACTSNC